MAKPRIIMLLAGLAAVVLTIAVGLSWKQIYYAIWPEARFWGRWALVEPKNGPVKEVEFFTDGSFDGRLETTDIKGFPITIRVGQLYPSPRYTVVDRRLALSWERTENAKVIDSQAFYHFVSEDRVRLSDATRWFLLAGENENVIFRRLLDTEAAP